MRYIITKLIQDTPEYHVEFRGSKLFDSIEAVQEYCKDEYELVKRNNQHVTPEKELIFDESALGQDSEHNKVCCCKTCEIIRYGKPYAMFFIDRYDPKYDDDSFDVSTMLPTFIGQYVKYFITVLAEEDNQDAYETLLKQHTLHDVLNSRNCFIESVHLGNFTATYDNLDHGYIDLMLVLENTYSESVLERAAYPHVKLPIRIFVETPITEKQCELFRILRGFRKDVRDCMDRMQKAPDPESGMYRCNLSITDNVIRLNYKTKSGGGCSHRQALRIRYQHLKKEN